MKNSGSTFRLILGALIFVSVAALGTPVTKVYVPSGSGNELVIYGSAAENLIRVYIAEFDVDRAFAKPDHSEIWLFGAQTSTCEVLNATSDRQAAVFDVEIEVEKIVFSPDGLYGFAVGYESRATGRQVFAIDCENYELLYPLTEVDDVGDVVVTSDSRRVWVSSIGAGIITCFEIPSFQPVDTVYVGPEPVDLELTNNGKTLIAVCRGIAAGTKGGAQIVALSTADGSLSWINNQLGSSLSALSARDNFSKFVLSYSPPSIDPPCNIREFSGKVTERGLSATAESYYLIGAGPKSGLMLPSGTGWLGCDDDAGLIRIDLESDSLLPLPEYLTGFNPSSIAVITVNVDEKLSAINSELQDQAMTDLVPERLLEYAYLQKTAGNDNDVVSTYKRIIETYPASYAAIEAGLEMSKFTFNDNFFIQSGEYAVKALTTLRDYLAATVDPRFPPMMDLKLSVERLALLSDQFSKDYLEDVAKKFLDLSAQHRILADLYFVMGYHLYRIDEEGTARKCLSEVRNQLTAINEPEVVRDLSARLALATGDNTAYYKIKEMKNAPMLDGDLGEWKDIKSIQMSAASGWYYGKAGWGGQEDLTAVMYVAHRKDDIYFAGVIFDDSLVSTSDGKGDRIRLFVDLRPTAGSYYMREIDFTEGCYQFSVIAPSASQPKARLIASIQAPYEIASARSEKGYNFELRMPLVAFGNWFTSDLKRLGLGIELIDADDADEPDLQKALGFVLPSSSPGGPPMPALFGVAELQ